MVMFLLWAVDNIEILRNICFPKIHGIKRRRIQDYRLVYHSRIILLRELAALMGGYSG